MIAAKVASSGALDKIAQEWRMPKELASDLVSPLDSEIVLLVDSLSLTYPQVKLSLFDVVLYIDDSGSMAFEERGERIDDLKLCVIPSYLDSSRVQSLIPGPAVFCRESHTPRRSLTRTVSKSDS